MNSICPMNFFRTTDTGDTTDTTKLIDWSLRQSDTWGLSKLLKVSKHVVFPWETLKWYTLLVSLKESVFSKSCWRDISWKFIQNGLLTGDPALSKWRNLSSILIRLCLKHEYCDIKLIMQMPLQGTLKFPQLPYLLVYNARLLPLTNLPKVRCS